jgi:hypothetical protein
MPIHFNCACGEPYEVDDSLEGEQARCQACGQSVTIRPGSSSHVSAESAPKPNGLLTALFLLGQIGLAVGLAYYLETKGKFEQVGIPRSTDNPFAIRIILASCFFLFCIFYPFTLPTMLSRRRYLSLLRWLIISILAAILGATSFLLIAIALSLKRVGIEWHQAVPVVGACLMTIGCSGFLGSLIAAAVHPKYRT